MNELKPCPFCGGEAEMDTIERYDGANIFFVKCTTCQMTMPLKSAYSEAIAAWNRRVDARQLALKTRVCPMCEDCPDGCPVETPKDSRNIVTNADRIRSMTDEELAVWLVDANMCERVCAEEDYCGCDVCVKRVIDWLERPVKEEHNETDRR
jgi:Lar family restriction alleviation protein